MQRTKSEQEYRRQIADARRNLDKIEADLVGLMRRTEHAASDGYPSSSRGGGSSGSISDPTAAAATEAPIVDWVHRNALQTLELVTDICKRSTVANNLRENVMTVELSNVGRQSQSRYCDACDSCTDFDSDARSGFCGRCRKAWSRYRQGRSDLPSREQFIRERRAILERKASA